MQLAPTNFRNQKTPSEKRSRSEKILNQLLTKKFSPPERYFDCTLKFTKHIEGTCSKTSGNQTHKTVLNPFIKTHSDYRLLN